MRIGLLAGRTLREHQLKILRPILADRSLEVPLLIIDARPPKTVRRKVCDHLKKGRGLYVLILAVQRLLTGPLRGVATEEFCRRNGIEFCEARDPYAPQTRAQIRTHHLDVLVLLGGFGIIREPLLSLCPQGILSYHHGDMRKYRGMPPGWWELYHGEREMGITVQKLAAGLDCGVPIEEKRIPIYPNDTVATLQARLYTEDEDMLYVALRKVSNPDFTPTVIREFGRVYTLPNFHQWITLNARVAYRKWRCRRSLGLVEVSNHARRLP